MPPNYITAPYGTFFTSQHHLVGKSTTFSNAKELQNLKIEKWEQLG